jgi:hypothetical protein
MYSVGAKPTVNCMQSLACETVPESKTARRAGRSVCKRTPAPSTEPRSVSIGETQFRRAICSNMSKDVWRSAAARENGQISIRPSGYRTGRLRTRPEAGLGVDAVMATRFSAEFQQDGDPDPEIGIIKRDKGQGTRDKSGEELNSFCLLSLVPCHFSLVDAPQNPRARIQKLSSHVPPGATDCSSL